MIGRVPAADAAQILESCREWRASAHRGEDVVLDLGAASEQWFSDVGCLIDEALKARETPDQRDEIDRLERDVADAEDAASEAEDRLEEAREVLGRLERTMQQQDLIVGDLRRENARLRRELAGAETRAAGGAA